MEPKLVPGILMILLTAASLVWAGAGLRKSIRLAQFGRSAGASLRNKAFLATFLWIIGLTVGALTGFLGAETLPPRPILLMLGASAFLFLLSFSNWGTALLRATPPYWLVLFQSFRIGVEIILYLAHQQGLMPEQMTWEGYNYDVLTGVLALPAAWIMYRRPRLQKSVGFLFNSIGFGLLLVVLTIALLSMPTPFQYFKEGPSIMVVGTFPFIFLPGVLVVLAVAGHLLSLRQLFLQNGEEHPHQPHAESGSGTAGKGRE